MAFLEVNGVPVITKADSFAEERTFIADTARRGVTGRLIDNRVATKRRFRVTTSPYRWAEADRLIDWIEGRGHSWSFDSSIYADRTAVGPALGGASARSSGGKYGSKLTVASGSFFGVQMLNKGFTSTPGGWTPALGWTLMTFKFVAAASPQWQHHIAHGAVIVTRGASANPAGVSQYVQGVSAPSAGMGNWLSVKTSSPYFGISGRDAAGTAGDANYDELVLLPWQVNPAWVPAIFAAHSARAFSPLPLVLVGGDCLNGNPPILMRGYVHDVGQLNGRLPDAAGHEAQNRTLQLVFEEA